MSRQPSLAEVISSAIESRLLDVHVSVPGRIQSYDSARQVADVLPMIRRAIDSEEGRTVHEQLPVIPNVPVGWPRGGGYGLQFPISKGDHVWLVFSESSYAQWRATGDLSDPGDLRRHDISYPVALPCISPDSQTLPSAAHALLSVPGGGKLVVSAGGETDAVALAGLVGSVLSALKGAIDSAASTEAGNAGLGGMTALKAALQGINWPGDVAASTLEAE